MTASIYIYLFEYSLTTTVAMLERVQDAITVDFIMVERGRSSKDEEEYGEYRTKQLVLEAYDALAGADMVEEAERPVE